MVYTVDMTEQTAQKKKICIVDDDPFLLDMYNLKFQQAHFDLACFTDSEKALEELRAHGQDYAAVLLDLVMPRVDGYDILRHIREENLCGERTVIVILSNQGQDKDVSRAEEFGIDGYLIKASTLPSEVLTQVTGLITKKSAP
jgi:DNA-binding response OmpR family regulator